ncbi:TlpA family protein disulfide reductase [Flavisolibacter nicotianae]|uniref:TlpA family protein disulfide reductase n=1 Tax=Flavisolibacter nicotianae TaxID=2364882 RepID=UPI000EB47663|nr:TlpA disulfide reductase family protein [Flavisolibacter nicotianae]
MKKTLIISASVLLATFSACSDSKKNGNAAATTEVVQTSTDHNTASAPVVAASLPSFAIQDMQGRKLNLQSLKGKKVFVNLWASWCPPCRREMPSIEKLSQAVDANRVMFVMISLDDQFEQAKQFVKAKKMQLPVYYPTENLPAMFRVPYIPATFIFDEKGELIKQVGGSDDYNTARYKALLQ